MLLSIILVESDWGLLYCPWWSMRCIIPGRFKEWLYCHAGSQYVWSVWFHYHAHHMIRPNGQPLKSDHLHVLIKCWWMNYQNNTVYRLCTPPTGNIRNHMVFTAASMSKWESLELAASLAFLNGRDISSDNKNFLGLLLFWKVFTCLDLLSLRTISCVYLPSQEMLNTSSDSTSYPFRFCVLNLQCKSVGNKITW